MNVSSFSNHVVSIVAGSLFLNDREYQIVSEMQDSIEKKFIQNHIAQKNKYEDLFDFNVDQVMHFVLLLQKKLWDSGYSVLAQKVYYYTRTSFNIDVFPSRKLPLRFRFVHPLGLILGNAEYGNCLVCYQGVTVGGNPKLEYPKVGEQCVLYAGSKVFGRSVVGSNSVVGAGVVINNEVIPENSIVYLDGSSRKIKENMKNNRREWFG